MANVQLSFVHLQALHHFSSQGLATQASVSTEVVDRMLNDLPVGRSQAQDVLKALHERTGCYYTLANVQVKLSEEEVPHHE